MKEKLIPILSFLALITVQGCAEVSPIPLQKDNLEALLAENEGLEVGWENAKDVRDFYRGGVQQKAKAEKRFPEKAYRETMNFYRSSKAFFQDSLSI